jgi:outer membrane protein
MKNVFTLLFLLASVTLFSQVEKPITKGNFLIGGGASGNYNCNKSENDTLRHISVGINPSIGYFIIDGLAVGLSISPSYSSNLGKNKQTSFFCGFGPYLKYYTSSGFFVGATFYYSTEIQNSNYFNSITDKFESNKNNSHGLGFTPEVGYAYFINSKIAIETSLNYNYYFSSYSAVYSSEITDIKGNNTSDNIYFSLGFQMFW